MWKNGLLPFAGLRFIEAKLVKNSSIVNDQTANGLKDWGEDADKKNEFNTK